MAGIAGVLGKLEHQRHTTCSSKHSSSSSSSRSHVHIWSTAESWQELRMLYHSQKSSGTLTQRTRHAHSRNKHKTQST
jgi:hypothetical protein